MRQFVIASYPYVEGTREEDNPDHWYWGYCYEVLVEGKWIGQSLSVPKHKVSVVQKMIGDRLPVSAIKAFLSKEKSGKSHIKD
ncbi:hypothetical protein WA1_50100 [Scytonema hofmannii PCC 7110]|uniref:Uncharacterized protein n=1 Tax=Scytonema hofmannii PCC 7110 TaxID=128403 RepID=A0A139WR15_9CYAN|nr:hypothetical protein [Scytonema hofmannii]KYC34881.1 hypothetical protein WA1_50100 [Scytonema hofmannii PCC 7110]